MITVIIVSWNVKQLLRGCLLSLFAQTEVLLGAIKIKVIVVDNASSDGTVEMVRADFPDVHLIASKNNLGFGAANTLAFDGCEDEYILLLNPDTIVPDGALLNLLAKIHGYPDVAALGCRLNNADGSLQRWTGGSFPSLASVVAHYLLPSPAASRIGFRHSVYLAVEPESDLDVDWVCGACIILRRSMAPKPLFDPAYWLYGEDIDMCYRIKRAGGRVMYTPEIAITHFQGASIRQQKGDVLLTSLNGMRQFYSHRAGPIRLLIFDLATIAGFSLRWMVYRVTASLRRDAGMAEKARQSARYLVMATRLMRKT
jgi:N-acetylglucosaminyl-diphospho-decaprenol L-rhamnosyltransferase